MLQYYSNVKLWLVQILDGFVTDFDGFIVVSKTL